MLTSTYKVILYLCIVGTVYARTEAEIKSWFMTLGIECSPDHKVTAEEIQSLHEHKIPDNENAKCLINCIFKKSGLMDDKGMYDVQGALEMAEKEHLEDSVKLHGSKKLIEFCQKVNTETVKDGEKGCERAALLAKCFIDNMEKHGLKV